MQMDTGGICATPFWNESISWDTKNPYFSECFKHLVLVIGSCAVLWVVAPLEFVKICRFHGTPAPWTTLSVSKMIAKILLLIVCVIELAKEIYAYVTHAKYGSDGLLAAIAYFFTIVLTVILTLMCKKRGLPSSLALPSFWMISTITTLISIYDDINDVDWNDWISSISLVDDSLVFVISLIQLILSCMVDKPAPISGRQFTIYCPLNSCSLPSRLTFSWLLKLFAKSTDNSLHQDYLIPQCFELRSATVTKRFEEIWKGNFIDNEHLSTENTDRLLDNEEECTEARTNIFPSYSRKRISLLQALMKTSSKYLIISFILEILFTVLYFLPTYILSLILHSEMEQEWHKYLFAITLFVALLLCTFADSQRKYFGLVAALRIKTAVMNAIFEKALVSRDMHDVKNHLHEDAENIFQMVCLASEVWGAPIRLLIGLYLLWIFLGSASFIGVATAALLIPLNILIAHTASYFQNKAVMVKGERLNVLKETLNQMKILKFYAWEDFFLKKLLLLRKSEISKLRKTVLLKIGFKFLILSSSSLVSLVTFTVFVLMKNPVDTKTIFVSLYLIYLLKTPFTSLLRLLAYFVQGLASVAQIQKFLEANETHSLPQDDNESGNKIILKNATFACLGSETPCLKKINLNVRDGSVIAVVGDSLSGKSSLLRALLGQMEKLKGAASMKGEVAFVADTSWIQNTTLEKNILFLRPKVNLIYRKTLEACNLLQDIDILPEGDETEIGEKGYHLSEDKKFKIDLARSVYQNSDIYLLDDPFVRIETPVAEHLYQRVIGHSGILRKKIRIFTTKDAMFLPLVDHILFMKDGCILEQGSYTELIEKSGYLAGYLNHLSSPISTVKKTRKNITDATSDLSCTENFKDHCDPWYSASGVSLKPEVEGLLHGETPNTPKALYRKLLSFMKMNGHILTVASILGAVFASCCEIASWIWWTQWNTETAEGGKLYKNLYIYAGLILSHVFCTAVCGIFIFFGSTLAVGKLYCWLLNRIIRAPVCTFASTFVEKVSQSFDKDLQYTDEQIPMVFYIWLVAVVKAPVLLIVIFIKAPILCIFSVPLMVAFFVILRLYLNTWRQLHRLTAATRCPLSNLLKEALHGISSIRAYNASSHFINRFHLKLDTHNNCYFLFLLVSRWLSSSVEIIGSFFVLLAASTILVQKGENDNIGLVIIFAMQIAESLIALTYMSSLLDVDLSALERFQSFSEIKQESEWENPSCQLPPFWPTKGSICIQNLSTTYGEALYPVLNNVSISVRPGEKIAITGKEESGIYTILDSLFRIREISEGQIIIDNVDISNVGLHDLRSKLAFVPQDPLVFDATVRENLDPENNNLDEELHSAIKLANLNSYFADLDKVIENHISLEDKYKISLARCILKKPKIVIMDEPENSPTDGKNIFQHCTLLTFGDCEVLDNYDRIIRISSGEVVEVFSDSEAAYH